MRIVITQPTYLSWTGYYGMIDLADKFVFYDDVQFERRSWQSRNKIKSNNAQGWQWLSVPIIHNGQEESLKEVMINYSENWREKHWKSIYYAYCKAPYFNKYKDLIEGIYKNHYDTISDLNIYMIKILSEALGVKKPEFILSSELRDVKGVKTDRLINVLKALNVKGQVGYISTIGTKAYIETESFKNNNFKLCWYDYKHPIYNQERENFIPYLSIVDLLFNEGENSINILRSNLKSALKEEI